MHINTGKLKYIFESNEEVLNFDIKKKCSGKGVSIISQENKKDGGNQYSIKVIPHGKITLLEFMLPIEVNYNSDDRIFANGYESWTDSREFLVNESIQPLDESLSKGLLFQGDYPFYKYTGKKGLIHSFSYTYIKQISGKFSLWASLSENNGFTIFEHNTGSNLMNIVKDCKGLEIDSEYTGFDLLFTEGEEKEVFDKYFGFIGLDKIKAKPASGWTSWYYHYTNISEEIIMENLNAFAKRNIPIDIFQIDDGYQKAIGDWLKVNEKFPRGMKYLADEIKKNGFKAGLWLAPFLCVSNSDIYKEHIDWLLKDENGNPVTGGISSGWGGAYYAMDIYNEDFRDYLKEVFDTVLNVWGFDMVKLDFLYAACINPRKDKTRGQIMWDAMKFLRQITGDKLILGCGVPLASCIGNVEYCRIGCDVALTWEDEVYKKLNFRERNSTINSLVSTIGRRHLNSRAFYNDPDVFILRSVNVELNKEQRYTLTLLNNIFGDLCFTSDNLDEYTKEEMYTYKSLFPMKHKDIQCVEINDDYMTVRFCIEDKRYIVLSNLSDRKVTDKLKPGLYFNSKEECIYKGGEISLMPYESICLLETQGIDYEVLGSKGKIFPGSEVHNLEIYNDEIKFEIDKKALNHGEIFIKVADKYKEYKVNGRTITVKCFDESLRIIEYRI